jgi:hypothetical protein
MKIFKQVISLIILSSLILSCSDVWQQKEAKLETSEIESLARIKLPASNQNIQVHNESGIDKLILIRLVLNKKDLNSFLKNAGYVKPLKQGFRPFTSEEFENIAWWNPDDAKEVMGGFLNTQKWASEIMVDISSPNPVIYFKTHDL